MGEVRWDREPDGSWVAVWRDRKGINGRLCLKAEDVRALVLAFQEHERNSVIAHDAIAAMEGG